MSAEKDHRVVSYADGRKHTTAWMTQPQAEREAASLARNPTVERVRVEASR